jgi:hypothetical protein
MGQTQPEAGRNPSTIEVIGHRFSLASPTTATALGAVVLVLVIAGWTLSALDHQLTISNIASGLATILAFAGVAVVVAPAPAPQPCGMDPDSHCLSGDTRH